MSIRIGDWCPLNTWSPVWTTPNEVYPIGYTGRTTLDEWHMEEPEYITDATTGRKYVNESKESLRIGFLILSILTPMVCIPASGINVVYRTLKLVTLSHFWIPKSGESSYDLRERSIDAGKDVLRVLGSSLLGTWVFVPLSIYGVISPYDGRKLYATTERALYERGIVCPDFQPDDCREYRFYMRWFQ